MGIRDGHVDTGDKRSGGMQPDTVALKWSAEGRNVAMPLASDRFD